MKTFGQLVKPVHIGVAPPIKKADPFYQSADWVKLVAAIKKERGDKCEDCGAPGSQERIAGDHLKERRDGGAPLDKRNVRLRCYGCHRKKTARVREQRQRRVL